MRLALALFYLISVVNLGTALEIPSGGQDVLPDDAAIKMSLQGGSRGRRSVVWVSDMPFNRAIQGQTLVATTNSWSVQFSINTTRPVKKNDVLLAVFWARGTQSSDETGEVFSEFIFERNGEPWTKSVSYPIVVVNKWKQFMIPFTCAENYDTGRASVKFRLGYKPQTLQIGGLEVINYGTRKDLDDLPRTSLTYAGMEPDAPWRIQAEEMIDQHRKGDIHIKVLNARRSPIAGATVRVQMTRHAYAFGSAVDAQTMMRGDANSARYNETITTYFNRVVMENDLKWWPWENWDRVTKIAALDFLRDHDIEIRGHCLVWPSWRHMPGDLEDNKNNPAYLRARVLDHIEDEVGTLAGRLVDWDVINENYSNHDIMDILGDEVMVDWFQLAHSLDPEVKLYLNDYSIISGGGLDEAHRNHYIQTVQYLLDEGAPLHGLGTQCHFGSNPTPPERIWTILDQLDDFGLEVQATEFDVFSDDREFQVNYTRDFMTAYFAHPSTVGILMWGFWEGKHWRPKAALWDKRWNLLPHGQVWVDLVTQTWWTDTTVTTDEAGEATVRGFYGDYTLTLTHDDRTIETNLTHRSEPTTVIFTRSRVEVE